MTYPFDRTFELSPLSTPVLTVLKPLSQVEKRNIRREEKAQKQRDIEHKQWLRTPVYRHMIHKPTFCVLTHRNALNEPLPHDRHQLSNFKSKNETFSGLAKTRMQTALNWLFLFSDKKRVYSKKGWVTKKGEICHNFSFRLAFITLTLSAKQKHTDEYIKDKMLKPFLHWITRSYKSSYVWKAETQLNGNIHFHITIDTFIHWKSVRAKWNSLLAREGYCKMFQDGTNDKGDSATQIKAIHNEKGHAKVVGGYLTKGSIEEKYHYDLSRKKTTIEELLKNSEGVSCNIENKKHYSRFVDGRLWSQSESLSNVDVSLSDSSCNLKVVEGDFFKNNEVKNLGRVLLTEAVEKHKGKSEQERLVLGYDELSLKKKYSRFFNVFIHKNLKFARLPDELSAVLVKEKESRKFNLQRSFTVDSLF